MPERVPDGDAVLVQFSIRVQYIGASYVMTFHDFVVKPKTSQGIEDKQEGLWYEYLRVYESVTIGYGLGPFPLQYILTYMGNGKLIVIPKNPRKQLRWWKQQKSWIITVNE